MTRSYNNSSADCAKTLFCRAFSWHRNPASNTGYDAPDDKGLCYEIKCGQITVWNRSCQLSALRDLDKERFDFLTALLFDGRYNVKRAVIIPHRLLVGRFITFSKHLRASIMHLRDEIWTWDGVKDVTGDLVQTAQQLRHSDGFDARPMIARAKGS